MFKSWKKHFCAVAAALLLVGIPAPPDGHAVLSDVYFTAVNEQLLDLSSDTMPFWSGGVLYVSSRMFEGTDAGVNYVRNNTMGLAMLYTNRIDLRFDLEGQSAYDKRGNVYNGHAIERSGVVFFPVDLVCRYFGLTWSYTPTDLVPLIRIKSASGVLDDVGFIDAAAGQMSSRYSEYEKSLNPAPEPSAQPPAAPVQPPPELMEEPPETPSIHAEEGQKIFLIIDSVSREDTLSVLQILDGVQATFVLSTGMMEDGDLLRGLTAGGHSIALRMTGDPAEEIEQARELLWQAACSRLELVWYEGREDIDPLLEETGCVRLETAVDWRGASIRNSGQEGRLLQAVGRYRTDLAVHLGADSACVSGLRMLLDDLLEGQYQLSAWRLGWRA